MVPATQNPCCVICGSHQRTVKIRYPDHTLFTCHGCGLVYTDFMPSKDETEAYYNEYDYRYLLKYREQTEFRGIKILAHLEKLCTHRTILDVGCGCGFFLNVAKQRGWDTQGIELSGGACQFAREHLGLTVHNCDIHDAQLPDNSVAVITLQHVLEHLADPHTILTDLKSKLMADGILVIVVPNARSAMAMCARDRWLCLAEKTHLFHYHKKSLSMLLTRAGFTIVKNYSLQWNVREFLWALKIALKGPIKTPLKHGAANTPPDTEPKPRGAAPLLQKLLSPVSTLLGISGLGAELIVIARKGSALHG
jgi:2-polyprenyl-3-methyl-5-hydroxy-6-metoxy-1,4-benzoquinol methylase